MYRVFWIPKGGAKESFYVPVQDEEEGYRIINLLSDYDLYEYRNEVKHERSTVGGLQRYDAESGVWVNVIVVTRGV